jgi:hypothetical protein
MIYTLTIKSSDESDIKTTLRAREFLSCLRDITNDLREKSKYATLDNTTWGEVYELLWQHLSESNIDPFSE